MNIFLIIKILIEFKGFKTMKIIGLEGKTFQYLYYKLGEKVTLSFPEDLRESEVLLCQSLEHLKKNYLKIQTKKLQYKVVIILDYKRNLNRIKGIQILEDIPDSFVDYIKNICTYATPKIYTNKDDIIKEVIRNKEEQTTFFTSIIYPLLYKGIIEKEKKKQILKSIVISIKSIIKRNKDPDIVKYEKDIRKKYYKAFISWLKTKEAREVCQCLLTGVNKDKFNTFEINYLLKVE